MERIFFGKLSQTEYSLIAKFCTSLLYAKYHVVVEEYFYDVISTKFEFEGKQIFEMLGEDLHSHDEEQTFMTSTVKGKTIHSNREKSLIVFGVCYQRKGKKIAL